ncbi:hypothetical protein [Yoonia sp.]|uniref:hypothetical protein n=1 Tax=Yoonia sp. TaxID=2212373 RepID=UPI0019DEA9DA|nr:hypothetical protein [Yoonia sp.]MBE0412091.1 hypothetical protein [Yoonia sp.]
MKRNKRTAIRHRFERQFHRMSKLVPGMAQIRSPGWMIVRVTLALVFILGGLMAILPVFGLWMIPLGLLLLAVDVPMLQGPIASLIIRGRRRINTLRRRFRARK